MTARNAKPTPTIGAHCPDHGDKGLAHRYEHRGALPRPSVLNRLLRLHLRPDHRAPSKNLPSGTRLPRPMFAPSAIPVFNEMRPQ
jgi:hypothetical protein